MKILFAIPKSKSLFGDEPSIPEGTEGMGGHPHLGIAYLTSFLKQKKVDVKIYDDTVDNSRVKLKEIIDSFAPDVIGITAFSYSYKFVLEIINKTAALTDKPIVVGGPHVSATNDEILKSSKATFAIRGEGEYTLLELLNTLHDKKYDFKNIDGLIWRDEKKTVINKNREFIKDLDLLPYPDFEAFQLEKYTYSAQKKMPIISSRGCPYGCTFCSVRLSMGRGFRDRSPENFVDELKHWYDRGWTNFEINDDCYSTKIDRVIKISNLIIRDSLKIKYEIYNGIRVDRINLEAMRKLKESGCSLTL